MDIDVRGRPLATAAALLWVTLGAGQSAAAAELAEPPVLTSTAGVLDLLMVARAAPIASFSAPTPPTGWVFDVCERPADGALACPAVAGRNLYGGTRLQLKAGDTLKIRLVNRLPPVTDSEWASVPTHRYLALNPVNIHTHGMLVSPRMPTVADPTYGDSVFVMTLNPDNGPLPPGSMIHGDVRTGYADYRIHIPASHPSGLYWFHPHVHGISVNQVSAGMAGVITVGRVSDYVAGADALPQRHILLKDTQIAADGHLVDEQLPLFCPSGRAPGSPAWQGSCPGAKDSAGGRWFFTLNGQPYPTATIAPGGEIWRLTNASASVAYDLGFHVQGENRDLIVQVLAIDGVAVRLPKDYRGAGLANVGAAQIEPTPCGPGAQVAADGALPLCAGRLLMLPSSRVEVWVAYRDAQGRLAPPGPGPVVLRTIGRQTGPTGDSWPAIDLAKLVFLGGAPAAQAPQTLQVSADARRLRDPRALSRDLMAENAAAPADDRCQPLAPGHRRRIFLNALPAPPHEETPFGLGYEETDARGVAVPGTFVDVAAYDPDRPTICLPLGPGNTPVHETWELVNLAGEDHNFHIHQVKFAVATRDALTGDILPTDGVLHDNAPVRHADGQCGSVAGWRKGRCLTHPVLIDVPFAIAGNFVYHCHILEHEDGGMMAVIRVRSVGRK